MSDPEGSLPLAQDAHSKQRGKQPAAETRDLSGCVELRIPSRPEWVAVARLTIAAVAHRLPFTVEEIEDVKLAIAEACTTVIQGGASDGTIHIICETDPDQLRIRVRDAGSGDTEGLGVFLIGALMDDVRHTADPQSGSELLMIKRVAS